jgi:type I restriction enzyme S subunit
MAMEQFELPENWEMIPFEECIADLSRFRKKLKTIEYNETGKYPIVDQGQSLIVGYTDDTSMLFPSELPVIIFGDHTKVIKYVDFPFVVGADGTKILKPDNRFEPKFVYYFLQSIRLFNLGYSRHFKLLKEINVPWVDITEQRRIVARIEELTKRVEEAKKIAKDALVELDSFTPALLAKAFRGEL